jgi:hypothetical protein
MCQLCRKIDKMEKEEALFAIGEAMADCSNKKRYDHLSDLIDRVLGTDTVIDDRELDEAWERTRR